MNHCFDNKMQMADIDGFIDRHGYFLIIETKHPRAKLMLGMRFMYEQLVRTGLFTVIVVYGEENKPDTIEAIEVMKPEKWNERSAVTTTGKIKATRRTLEKEVSTWYRKAEYSKDKHGNYKPIKKNVG